MYRFEHCKLVRVIDGDTIVISVDFGYSIGLQKLTVRLAGINAPEINTLVGKEAKQWLMAQLPVGVEFVMESFKPRETDKYGRYCGLVFLKDSGHLPPGESCLNWLMVSAGHAVKRDY